MSSSWSWKGWLCLAAMLAAVGTARAQGQADLSGFHATPMDFTRIPRYCWGTFDEKYRKPGMAEFNLPGGCGERFNHYCPGVLSLARAKAATGDPARRSYWLKVAEDHMNYTVDGIKNLPACPMREIVRAQALEIHLLRGGH